MRSLEEIRKQVEEKKPLVKSDVYGVSLIELFPFVPLDAIPDVYKDKFSQEAKDSWSDKDIDDEVKNWNFKEYLKDEVNYIYRLANGHEVIPASFRLPRIAAIIWLEGLDIDELSKKIDKLIMSHPEVEKGRKMIKRLCANIRKTYEL